MAAIGIKVSRWISLHGWALNISTDLTPFRRDFVPCGISDCGVTSLSEILGERCPSRADVEAALVAAFGSVFQIEPLFESFNAELGIIAP